MMRFLFLIALIATPAYSADAEEEARRDALTRFGVGILKARQGQALEAIKQLEQSNKQNPQSALAHRELAKLYANVGRDPAAIREARKALDLDPKDAETARILGDLLRDAKKYAEAAKAYRIAADAPGLTAQQRLNVLRELAFASELANDYNSACKAYQDAVSLISTQTVVLLTMSDRTQVDLHRLSARMYEHLGKCLVKSKKFTEARAAFEVARDLYAEPKQANDRVAAEKLHRNLADLHRAKGDPTAALRELDLYIKRVLPRFEYYDTYVQLMREAKRDKDIGDKLKLFAQLDNNKNGVAWLIAAEDLRTNSASNAAIAKLQTLANAGGEPAQYRVLVEAFRHANRWKELFELNDELAIAAKDKSEKLQPYRNLVAAIREQRDIADSVIPAILIRMSRESMELIVEIATREKKQEALTVLINRLVTAGTATANHYLVLFELYFHQQKWPELIRVAERASMLRGEDFTKKLGLGPQYQTAHAYAELNDRDNCLREIDYVINNIVAAGQLNAQMEKARLLVILGDYRGAQKICTETAKAYALPADQRRIAIVQADVYNHLKEHAKSEQTLRELLEADPDDVLVLNNLGYNLADQGKKIEEAEEMIRRAIELDRDQRLRVTASADAESGTYLDSLGWVLFRRGKLEEARQILEKASQAPDSMNDAIVWDHLGDVYYKLKMKAEAKQAWTKAIAMMKNSRHGREGGRLEEAKLKLTLVP